MPPEPERINFRVVLLGSVRTGKTSILNRFLYNKYEEKYIPTVEDLFSKDFNLGTVILRVDFLDTSGSMQFPAMRRLSINSAGAFLIVYSYDDLNSFQIAKQCIGEIQASKRNYQEIPIIIVGNKCDIPLENRIVKKQDIINYVFCELPKMRLKVMECSCKDSINIADIFKTFLSLGKFPFYPPAPDAGLQRRSSAHGSGKWRFSNIVSSGSDNRESNKESINKSNNKNTNNINTDTSRCKPNSNGTNGCKTSSNCSKSAVALIKSVTGNTLVRVGRSLKGGTNDGASCSGTRSHTDSNNNAGCSNKSGKQSPLIQAPQDKSEKNEEDNNNGHNLHQQNGVGATKSQPMSAQLRLDEPMRPRSRSLMRRSTRKSKIQDNDDLSECKPS